MLGNVRNRKNPHSITATGLTSQKDLQQIYERKQMFFSFECRKFFEHRQLYRYHCLIKRFTKKHNRNRIV